MERPRGGRGPPAVDGADGFVYMFVSPGTDHWRRLLDWLGHPAELDDPVFQHVLTRRREAARVDAVMRRFTATRTRTQLYAIAHTGIEGFDIGSSSAMSMILAAALMAVSALVYLVFRKVGGNE